MIEQSVTVRVDRVRAFRAWTEQVGLWWPAGHRISGDPSGRLILEGAVDGRFYERTGNGREFDYGRVVSWDPPRSLALAFYLGSGPDAPSLVEVTFTTVDVGTRVDIRHRAGELAADRFDQTVARFVEGWTRVAEAYAEHLT